MTINSVEWETAKKALIAEVSREDGATIKGEVFISGERAVLIVSWNGNNGGTTVVFQNDYANTSEARKSFLTYVSDFIGLDGDE